MVGNFIMETSETTDRPSLRLKVDPEFRIRHWLRQSTTFATAAADFAICRALDNGVAANAAVITERVAENMANSATSNRSYIYLCTKKTS